MSAEGHLDVPQLGRVIIGDDVEVGANSTIDRGAGPDTLIGNGCKIDNLVQIGHNVRMGQGCVVVAQSGVAGSTELSDFVVLAAQSGVSGHLKIAPGTQLAARSGIMRDTEPGAKLAGNPAIPAKEYFRQMAVLGKLAKDRHRKELTTEVIERFRAMDTKVEQPQMNPNAREAVDILEVMEMIPHRQPFLMIDRVEDIVIRESATGIKNVTINEPFFVGHFPVRPVMPGVLVIEAMAQTAAVLVVETLGPDALGKLVYFMTIDNARFRKPVVPGDQVKLFVSVQRNRGNVWKFKGVAKVGDLTVAEAIYSAMIMDA